ncbi:MAG: DUF5615 family PIN-like protein [Thermomicrobiales bacterium]|nr:DUF5615 family PIN-like protein [Thermomicrobiales bacterium]
MRFYLDENLPPQVAVLARARGVDAVSNHERGHLGLSDDEVLRLAAKDGRCVVTRNRDDFVQLTIRCFDNQWPHTGVLIVPWTLPNDQFARMADALAAYAQRHDADLPAYTIDFLHAPPV